MALIAMATYCTDENKRVQYLDDTLSSLNKTVDRDRHKIIVVNNNQGHKETEEVLKYWQDNKTILTVITNSQNLGTAAAINLAWKYGKYLGIQNCIKMDDDVIVNYKDWVDEMEEAIRREPKIGQVGLKRKDCLESPDRTDFYKSELIMLPHKPGEKWMIAEKVDHVMGTCVMHSSALLDKIGYLYQPKVYGFDDSLASYRSKLAGFINVFLPHINIDHIDVGDTPYQKWKEAQATEQWQEYHNVLREYRENKRPIYYNPFN